MIISNCWRNRTQRFGPLSRFSSALMGESGMGRTKAAGWRKEEEREREMGCTNVSQGSQHLWLNWCKTPEPAQKVFGSSISSTTRALTVPQIKAFLYFSTLESTVQVETEHWSWMDTQWRIQNTTSELLENPLRPHLWIRGCCDHDSNFLKLTIRHSHQNCNNKSNQQTNKKEYRWNTIWRRHFGLLKTVLALSTT